MLRDARTAGLVKLHRGAKASLVNGRSGPFASILFFGKEATDMRCVTV